MTTLPQTPSLPATQRRASKPRGFSIVEALCTLAVLATAAGTAVPAFDSLRTQRRLDGMAAQLETDIQFARSEAVRSNRPTRLSVQSLTEGTCYVIHTGKANDCRCTDSGTTECQANAIELRTVRQLPLERVSLRSSSNSIAFDPHRGTVTPTATLRMVANDGRAVHQVVNVLGRVRSCSPQSRMLGYRAC